MQNQDYIYVYSLSAKALHVSQTYLFAPFPFHSLPFSSLLCAKFYGLQQPGPFPMASNWVWSLESTNRRSDGRRREKSRYLFPFSAGPHFGHGFSLLLKAIGSVEQKITVPLLQPQLLHRSQLLPVIASCSC